MKTNKLTLRPVEDSDIYRLQFWLNKEHVLRWYYDADEWLNEIKERNGTFGFIKHFIVSVKGIPFGFCQYYDCFDAKEEWYEVEAKGRKFSIDYLIGEEEYLRKGYGKTIVNALVEKIKVIESAETIVVQPEKDNIASNKALIANGFLYDESKEYYKLNLD